MEFGNGGDYICERVMLDKVLFHAKQHFALEGFQCIVEAGAYIDRQAKALVVNLVAEVAGRVKEERETFRHPRNWWEHFKMTCFPAWALRRWPVKWIETTIVVRTTHVCPHLPIPRAGSGHMHIDFLRRA